MRKLFATAAHMAGTSFPSGKLCRAFAMLAAVSMLYAAPVQAAGIQPYMGIGVGGFNIKYNEVVGASTYTLSDTVLGGFVQAGLDFNDYFGASV